MAYYKVYETEKQLLCDAKLHGAHIYSLISPFEHKSKPKIFITIRSQRTTRAIFDNVNT